MEKGNQCHAHMREILAKVSITSSTETAAFDAALGLLERSLFDYSAALPVRNLRATPMSPSVKRGLFQLSHQACPSSQAVGLLPVTRMNSRLKFDLVLKPLESMAAVTLSPAFRRAQA